MSIIEKALKKQGAKQQTEKALEASGSIAKAMAQKNKVSVDPPLQPLSSKDQSHPIQVEDEVRRSHKEPVLSTPTMVIDTQKLKDAGMVSHDNQTATRINNEYRSIKQKLLYNAFGPAAGTLNHSNMVMITSARPAEGKTFTAVNLAMSVAAEKDKTILLVDADVLKPSISATLGVDEKPGLIDYLLGDVAQLSDVIYSTNIPNLRVLPAGSSHHLSNELLASDRMESLTTELANRYSDRLVVFDCPPMLGVVETLTVSRFMGQAMIVVSESMTKMSEVEQTVADLNKEMAIGFVVNKALSGTNSQYGYGYGYGAKTNKI